MHVEEEKTVELQGWKGRGGNRVVSGSAGTRSVRVQSDSPRVTVSLENEYRRTSRS